MITRGERGGAQTHVLDLVRGLLEDIDFQVAVGESGFLVDELRALGVEVHVLEELQRAISPGQDLRACRSLRERVRAFRPHLIHTHSTKAGVLGRIAGRVEGVDVVHTAHSWSFSEGIPWKRRAMAIPVEAAAGRLTRCFIVVSDADRELGLRYRVARAEQLRVVHNGVEDLGPPSRNADASRPPVLVMVARMAEPKDHGLLLRALASLARDFRLCLVGDGPLRPQVEAAIQRAGLQDKVELVGESDAVAELLAASDVFVLVSKQEGFPISILEAMRAGLPVIASDVGGIREAVEHGKTGLLVQRGDESGLRDALDEVLDAPDLRAAMGAAGRRAYEERFTVAHMLRGTSEVYRELALGAGWPVPPQRTAP